MVAYAILYHPPNGTTPPGDLLGKALFLAVLPLPFAIAQLTGRFRDSRALALTGGVVDAVAVLGSFALFAFDPNRYELALVVLVHAEAGAVLGLPEALGGWALVSSGYIVIERYSASVSGAPVHMVDAALRIGVGLILALGGGLLSEELSGERRRRAVEREMEVRRL